ncbi:MAG: hydroxymethylbilane synthase [Candidatus Methylacidiphilales bacterium]|nr:hydroxymethylbilane synthase [Candidatus Methylacidiphilales bacterium]
MSNNVPSLSFIIGTRGSALALAQTRMMQAQLAELHPSASFELRVIKTTGDTLSEKNLAPSPLGGDGKGVFTAELESALDAGDIDIAVHSLKDLPTEIHPRFVLGAVPRREDSRDTLVVSTRVIEQQRDLIPGFQVRSLFDLPKGAIVATGSMRRQKQLQRWRPDFRFADIRGNIDTRLRKLRENTEWSATVLAQAGLNRLSPSLEDGIALPLPQDLCAPAPGQGALAIQVRAGDERTLAVTSKLHDPATHAQVVAERAFLQGLGGGCTWPVGAHAVVIPGTVESSPLDHTASNIAKESGVVSDSLSLETLRIELYGIYWKGDEPEPRSGRVQGDFHPASAQKDAEALGFRLARLLMPGG